MPGPNLAKRMASPMVLRPSPICWARGWLGVRAVLRSGAAQSAPRLLAAALLMVVTASSVASAVAVEESAPAPGQDSEESVRYDLLFHTTAGSAQAPQASSDYVVWQDRRDGTWAVYGYDVRGQQEFRITQPDTCNSTAPSISGHTVVWVRACPGPEPGRSRMGVYGYALDHEMEFLVYDGDGVDMFPRVEGKYVVWLADVRNFGGTGRGYSGMPMAHNLETGETWQLTGEREGISIGLSGGLAWWRPAGPTVYDLETKQSASAVPSPWVVWGAAGGNLIYHEGFQGRDSFFLFNPRSGESTPLAPAGGASPIYSPERELLIWQRGKGLFDSNLFAYDLRSQTEWQLTSLEGLAASRPSLAGDILAWQERSTVPSPLTDVYVARLSQPSPFVPCSRDP